MAAKNNTQVVLSVESLLAELAATPGSSRVTLRNTWTTKLTEAVMAGSDDAKVYAEALKSAPKGSTPSQAAEIDWRMVTAVRVANLRAAADAIELDGVRPTGTPDDVDLTDLPIVDATPEALGLAQTRLAGKRDVPEFIVARLGTLGAGFHTASDLTRGQHDAPGTGAIGAVYAKMADERQFTIEGVSVGHNDAGTQAFSLNA